MTASLKYSCLIFIGIASILKGELVTSGYISPGSGIIRTPTPTHMKTKLYTEPYSVSFIIEEICLRNQFKVYSEKTQ